MFGHDAFDVGPDGDLDVVSGLEDVHTIEHIDEAHTFERVGQGVVDHVEKDVGGGLVRSCDGEVVDLAFENDAVAVDYSRVEAWFVDCWFESKCA